MSATRRPLPLPPIFFVASIAASLLLAAGLIGLFAPEVAPFLADRSIAVACIVAGGALEIWAIFILIGSARQNAERLK
jgi:hypothetical protein